MKICKMCGEEKDINDFYKGNAKCKSCKIIYQRNYEISNKDKIKKYRKERNIIKREYLKERDKKYYELNKEQIKEKSKYYYDNNKEAKLLYQKLYNKDNKDIIKEYKKIHSATYKDRRNELTSLRKKNDPIFKLKCAVTNMIYSSFRKKGYSKCSRTAEIIGCTYEDFKLYLESKFEPWMTWENKGLYNGELNFGWDIDHIVPLDTAITEEDIIRLNHYSNLQPLCSKVNRDIKKNN